MARRFAGLRSFAAKNSRTVESDREFGHGQGRVAQAARRMPHLEDEFLKEHRKVGEQAQINQEQAATITD